MISRTTTAASNQRILYELQVSQQSLSDIQDQVTSGKRITKMSDAPSDAVSALSQRASLLRANQYDRNQGEADDWLNMADSTFSSMTGKLNSVRSLLVEAQSASQNPSSRQAIAAQISSLRDSLLGDANTQRLGRPLFGGTTASGTAYDAAGTYLGDNGNVTIPVSANTSITVNQTGPAVLGTHNAANPSAGDVFQVLSQLAIAVQNGDNTGMSAGLGQIDTATDRIAIAQVQVGARTNQLDSLKNSNANDKLTLQSSISGLEDVDLAQSIVTLKTREAGYQAALQSTAQISQLSLMDFLK